MVRVCESNLDQLKGTRKDFELACHYSLIFEHYSRMLGKLSPSIFLRLW
jgi:hypothetical protein